MSFTGKNTTKCRNTALQLNQTFLLAKLSEMQINSLSPFEQSFFYGRLLSKLHRIIENVMKQISILQHNNATLTITVTVQVDYTIPAAYKELKRKQLSVK